MNIIIEKLIRKEKITDRDIEDGLYEICEDTHASCGEECPVYDFKHEEGECQYFKNGKAMLKRLREEPKL